jgi:hypothetical protein
LSALVEDKVYPDPYIGMNLRPIPGTNYPIFEDFSNIQMPPSSPFRQNRAPMPPDKDMGVWRDVRIATTGPITMRYPAALPSLNLPSTDRAAVTVRTELTNASEHVVEAVRDPRFTMWS